MPRLLVLLLALMGGAGAVRAQDAPPQQAEEAAPAAPVTYVYGNTGGATPESLARVRRRIAEISGRGATGPTGPAGYPIIIIVPAPAQGAASPAPVTQAPVTTTAPGGVRARDLQRLEDNLARRFNARFDAVDERLVNLEDDLEATRHAPAPAPSVAQVEGALLETGLFLTTDVIFEFDKDTLLPVSEKTLDTVGEVLVRHPSLRVEVAGHTDGTGPEAYNQRLSKARAAAVRTYLLRRFDIAPTRIEAQGYGERRPVASNATVTGRTLNRRVEFRVLNP